MRVAFLFRCSADSFCGVSGVVMASQPLEQLLPPNIKVLADFGYITIRHRQTGVLSGGNHVIIEGPGRDIRNWLAAHSTEKVWIGFGCPQFQQFGLLEIKPLLASDNLCRKAA